MKLVIAEKPSVAQSLAAVLGAKEKKDGYMEGNGWLVSWCVGHLVEMAQPEAYGEQYAKWRYDDLPILPDQWKYEVAKDKKKQLDILRRLMNEKRVDSVVCATDAGREGELIFRLVYHQADCTKPILRLWIALFVLSGGGGAASKQFAPILAAVPLILLLTEKSWKGSVIYFVLYGGSYILQLWALPHLSGLPNFLVVAICGFFMRFVPGIMMGYITVRTTTVSEFVASMKKLHLPEQIIIPMSVIFRFFPTVVEEYNAIGDAMKMRGIRFGGGKASAMLEYRLVPVIMCSVKIGEELNAAALTRGLGGPVKRTNICEIGFHVQDVFFLLLCVVAFAIPIVTMITGR